MPFPVTLERQDIVLTLERANNQRGRGVVLAPLFFLGGFVSRACPLLPTSTQSGAERAMPANL